MKDSILSVAASIFTAFIQIFNGLVPSPETMDKLVYPLIAGFLMFILQKISNKIWNQFFSKKKKRANPYR